MLVTLLFRLSFCLWDLPCGFQCSGPILVMDALAAGGLGP